MGADPTAVGTMLLAARPAYGDELPFHELADRIPWERVPQFDPGESLVSQTRLLYHQELKARAAGGDKYAISMLLGQSNDDDPGGSFA